LNESLSKSAIPEESDYPTAELKKSLSYLEAGLNEITTEKQRLSDSIKRKALEASQAAKNADELSFINLARTLMAKSDLEQALKELEKVELNHQEKF